MKIYIAGPINSSGNLDTNIAAFARGALRLRDAGYEVVDPTETKISQAARDRARDMGTAFCDTGEYAGLVQEGIHRLMACQGICLLTGWQHSRGAVAEKAVADALGLRSGSVDDYCEDPVREIKWTGDDVGSPTRSYSGDAGFDLYVSERTLVKYNEFVDVPLGISIELPPGVWGMVIGRSSTLRKRRLLVATGVIDNGYRGPMFAGCQNVSGQNVQLERGERIAQMIPMPLLADGIQVRRVALLSESDRGSNGFGSTGV